MLSPDLEMQVGCWLSLLGPGQGLEFSRDFGHDMLLVSSTCLASPGRSPQPTSSVLRYLVHTTELHWKTLPTMLDGNTVWYSVHTLRLVSTESGCTIYPLQGIQPGSEAEAESSAAPDAKMASCPCPLLPSAIRCWDAPGSCRLRTVEFHDGVAAT